MSSRGPSSSSRNKKRQTQRGMAVLNLSDLIQNPALGNGIMDPTLITLLGQAGKMATLAQEFANTAKVHDPELRRRNVTAYFEKHHTEIDGAFERFVGSLDSLDELNAIPYEHMASVLENLEKQAEALKNLEDEKSQRDYAARCAVIKQKDKECVQLLLIGCEKINVWHALLTQYLPRFQTAEIQPSLILSKMFTDYSKATSYLVRRLLTSDLGEQDYYAIYQILSEKFQWLAGLIELYQKDPMPNIIEDILICLQNAACFRLAFLELEQAQQIKQLNTAFCDSLKPIIDEIAPRQERVKAALEKHDSMSSMTEEIQKNIWLSTFAELNDYLENQINVTPSQPLSLDGFKDKLTQLITELTIANERQYPELAQEWIKRLLELTSAFSMVDEAQKTADNQKLLFRTALMVLTYFKTKEPTMTSSYLGHCVMGALKALTTKLLESSKAALSTPAVALTLPLSTVDSSPASSSEPSAIITEQLAKLTLEEAPIAVEVVLEAQSHEVHEQERQTIMAEHQAALRANHEQDEIVKQQLIQKFSEQQQHELAELRQRLQQELTAEQTKLEEAKQKYVEKRTKRIASRRQQLTLAHQEQLQALRATQTSEIQTLKNSEKNDIEALEVTQKAELLKLEKNQLDGQQRQTNAHQKALADLTKQHHQALQAMRVRQITENTALAKRFEDELTALKNSYQAECIALKEQQSSQQQVMTSTHQASIEVIKTAHRRATDGHSPIGNIEVPTEILYIMQDLEDAGIEAYLVGGFVRDRLLGLTPTGHEDFDIIINAPPEKLPAKLKRFAQPNPFEPCQYKLGKMDLWCKPWVNLEEALTERDLTINTFICDLNRHAFDLLGVASDLKSPFLRLMGDLKPRFLKDPSLMMRLLRFSVQLNKGIANHDLQMIYQCGDFIRNLPSGIYFKNIEYLFVSRYSTLHLQNMTNADLIRYIFPGIIQATPLCPRTAALNAFWTQKLHYFSVSSECSYYHVFALFMLQPLLLRNHLPNNDLPAQLNHCIDLFFERYKGDFSDPDKSTFRHRILAIVLSKPQPENPLVGVYDQFIQFEGAYLAEQQHLAAVYQAAYTPQFAAQRAPEYIAPVLPAVASDSSPSSHKEVKSNTL